MRGVCVRLCAVMTVTGLIFLGNLAVAGADENQDQQLATRLERLEQQVHQLAERKVQVDDRGASMPEHRDGPFIQDDMREPHRGTPPDARWQYPDPRSRGAIRCLVGIVRVAVLVVVIINIGLAIWVFRDIRKRGEGSGFFIVLALIAGVPGTIVYVLNKISERKTT